jgi:hypothetical protein
MRSAHSMILNACRGNGHRVSGLWDFSDFLGRGCNGDAFYATVGTAVSFKLFNDCPVIFLTSDYDRITGSTKPLGYVGFFTFQAYDDQNKFAPGPTLTGSR